jgi:signal transduction histidine kinase
MTAATRRLWLYGLLLLLPALAVGGLALGLLAREQQRLAEREQAAGETRRAALEARARLIAENIELLIGDVQSALMSTLQEAPVDEPRSYLNDWQANNPLVREVFRATAEGRIIWGGGAEPLRAWLAQGAPWSDTSSAPSPAASARSMAQVGMADAFSAPEVVAATEPESEPDRDDRRQSVASNVLQYQRARQEIQEVAKLKTAPAPTSAPAAPPPAAASLAAAGKVAGDASERAEARRFDENVRADVSLSPRVEDLEGVPQVPVDGAFSFAPVVPPPPLPDPLTRSGWAPWRDASGLHLFGWRELPDRTVIGLALRLDAIKARLGEVFPAEAEPGDAYSLRDSAGAVWHEVGAPGLPVLLEVPLAVAALPGWSVAAYSLAPEEAGSGPDGFFALGAVLVGLLVLAILGAGALLLRQARLSEAEAAQKTSFVANVSHELKTPLTTIRLYAELLAQGRVRDEAKRADYLVTIGQETQRLARLVGNVLDFSRLEQGKKKFELAPVDMAAELRRLAETHAPRLAAVGLALRMETSEACELATDRDAVEQILLNLLDNACKYAAEGGEILLSLAIDARAGGGVRVVVADRGPGVPEGQRERIFEKFHRVDDRLTAERGGAGLGLSIARQLARGLGGELRCEGRESGGAAFVLTLPGS